MTPSAQSAQPHTAPSPDQSWEDRYDILLAAARTLHENGEETSRTLAAFRRLADRLGIRASLVPTWGELFVHVDGDRLRATAATPANVNMNRVVTTQRAVEAIGAGRLDGGGARAALADAARAPQATLPVFVLACAGGAGALALINGASHPRVVGIVALCAAAGALLRRGLARLSANSFLQIFAAALLAGLVGAVGVRVGISSDLRLVGLGPLLVLVPGPAILNGVFDLAVFRLPLGAARLWFGLLTILAITTGEVLGLALGGTTLPASVQSHALPLWLDVLCAGVAAGSYGIFFAMPPRMLVYPVLMGMLAHATRWWALSTPGMSNAAGAGVACLVVGVILVPIARRLRLPFAAVGFASVVSMIPGIYLFRMGGGLARIQAHPGATSLSLVGGVLFDGTTALVTVVTMALGLLLPKLAYDHLGGEGVIVGGGA